MRDCRVRRYAQPFDKTLLVQAIAVVVFQLALVQVCTSVRFDEKRRLAEQTGVR